MEETNKLKKNLDFNCDLAQTVNLEEEEKTFELIECVSSVNISCGVHAGNPLSIKKAIEYCNFKNKVIGAQIGLPEGVNGLELKEEELEALVLYQLGAISSFAKAYSMAIENVRPHGIMYQLAAENEEFSLTIAKAIKRFSQWLTYYGAAGSVIKSVSEKANINIAQEMCLDKIYTVDGLPDFSQADSADTGKSLIRLRRLINLSEIENNEQGYTKVEFDTIHFNIETENAAELLKEAYKTAVPCPVNFNKAETSGWV